MKHALIFIPALIFCQFLFSQTYPVAVDDTVTAHIGEYITLNVIQNDYHPSNLRFVVNPNVINPYIIKYYDDSTITFYFDYDSYCNNTGEYITRYGIIDEFGEYHIESFGDIHINIINDYTEILDINNVQATVTPYANHFWEGHVNDPFPIEKDSTLHFEYPKGSGKQTIFTSTFWIGGIDQNNQIRIAADLYRQIGIDYWSGPLSVDNGTLYIDTATVYDWHRCWKLNKGDIIFHRYNWWKSGYTAIENIANWPAHGDETLNQSKYLAPFIDVDGDGYYDPYSGDYPLIKGDQCVFFIFNDLRTENKETRGNEIGIEVHGMLYQFLEIDNDALNNTVFLSYKIFNRSAHTLSDTYIGMFTDIDLGYGWDDYIGCDVYRGMYFGYNGEEIDGNGHPIAYGENPPAQGVLFLGGPTIDTNNLDNPSGGCDECINGVGFGDGIIDNERYGMTSFIFFNNTSYITGDPDSASDYYNYMKAVWKDGAPLEYGNNGYPNSNTYGPECKFMFPGLTDSCNWGTGGNTPNGDVNWREENGNNGDPNYPADRRGLGSMGPFTFYPGTMQKIDIAYVVARGDDGPLSSVELLKVYADSIRARFIRNSDDFGTQYLDVNEELTRTNLLKIYPNPVTNRLQIENPDITNQFNYTIYDIYGRVMLTGLLQSVGNTEINMDSLEKGVYIVLVSSRNQKYSARIIKR